MTLEMLVGLEVIDDEAYDDYRAAMLPILEQHGGGFRYDFRVSEVLRSETEAPINRVFTIHFADEDAMHAFFADENYLDIKRRYFEVSVAFTTIIATYTPT